MADPTSSDPGEAVDDLSETVVASRVLHQGRYLTFRIDTVERADGTRAERDVAVPPSTVTKARNTGTNSFRTASGWAANTSSARRPSAPSA